MKIRSIINWKLFVYLLTVGLFGVVAIFPFLITTQGETLNELPISIPVALFLSMLQSGILISVAIFVGLLLGKKVGLSVPLLEGLSLNKLQKDKVNPLILSSLKIGIFTGLIIILLDQLFAQFINQIVFEAVPIWQGILASFYGGIVEEILMRLFLMTTLVWMFSKIFKTKKPTLANVWISIIITAVIFGIGHLPETAQLTSITPLIVIRAIALNGVGGIVFGWLYWKKGLEAAMLAHYFADITLLVIFPLFLK